jgi:hypothetical protein
MPYSELPNQVVAAPDSHDYPYRETGRHSSEIPLVLLQHFRSNLDSWDPAPIDDPGGIAPGDHVRLRRRWVRPRSLGDSRRMPRDFSSLANDAGSGERGRSGRASRMTRRSRPERGADCCEAGT